MESTILIPQHWAIVTCDEDRVYYDSDMLIRIPEWC